MVFQPSRMSCKKVSKDTEVRPLLERGVARLGRGAAAINSDTNTKDRASITSAQIEPAAEMTNPSSHYPATTLLP